MDTDFNLISQIAIAIAIAISATAAVFTFRYNRKLRSLENPTITSGTSGNTLEPYRSVSIAIDDPHREKWYITYIKVHKPRDARISEKVSNRETNKAEPGYWKNIIKFDRKPSSTGLFFKACSGEKVVFSVELASKANPKIKIKHKIEEYIHEYSKP